jgi:hypothetical protein
MQPVVIGSLAFMDSKHAITIFSLFVPVHTYLFALSFFFLEKFGRVWVSNSSDEYCTDSCPNECSRHGRCSGSTCSCDNDYTGVYCETSTHASFHSLMFSVSLKCNWGLYCAQNNHHYNLDNVFLVLWSTIHGIITSFKQILHELSQFISIKTILVVIVTSLFGKMQNLTGTHI